MFIVGLIAKNIVLSDTHTHRERYSTHLHKLVTSLRLECINTFTVYISLSIWFCNQSAMFFITCPYGITQQTPPKT